MRSGDYNSLVHQKSDDIAIQPAYTKEGLETFDQPFRNTKNWGVIAEVLVTNENQANKDALHALERGATGLLIYFQGSENISVVLEGVEIQYISLRLVVEGDPLALAQQLKTLIEERKLVAENLDIYFNHDPLENLARTGNWFQSETEDFQSLNSLKSLAASAIKHHSLNVNLFANAGATAVQQLGIYLAMAYETHYQLADDELAKYWVNFAVGQDYFLEIAKLRAVRRLWNQLSKELGASPNQPVVYAETSLRNKSIKDPHNNMIRTTAEAMAAIVGGADELLVRSFDTTLGDPTEFGNRVARNQQHILQYESHLSQVHDIAAGSYYLERLTEELAAKAWIFFQEIEEKGGYVSALRSGWLQKMIETSAQQEQAAYNAEDRYLVGVNKFAREDKELLKLLARPMFSSSNGKTCEVPPVYPIRLAEAFEKEFKNV